MNGTMRDVKVDPRDPTYLHEQVAAEIRRAIADGESKPGERLPPAKDLAAILDVNTNTVTRDCLSSAAVAASRSRVHLSVALSSSERGT